MNSPTLVEARLQLGQDLFLVYPPREREDPANPNYTTKTIPKVCGGSTPACLELASPLRRRH
jgi:UDP-N-acetyl-D-glucosamine dehydrogenase